MTNSVIAPMLICSSIRNHRAWVVVRVGFTRLVGGSIASVFMNAEAAAAIGWSTHPCGKRTGCSSRGSHSRL